MVVWKFRGFVLHLTTIGSCPIWLELDVGGVHVSQALSSKFDEECK